MSLTRFLRHTQGTRGQIRAHRGFGAPSLVGRGGRREYVPSIGSGLLLNMPLRKDTRMIYSAGGADGFSTETVDADGTYQARTAIGGLITGATANTARIEDDGVLVEGVRTNLCLQSEDFETTWAIYLSSVTISADQAVAPDGQTTADKITEAAITQAHGISQGIVTVAASTYTFSCYFKDGTRRWVLLSQEGTGYAVAWFDLENGVVGSTAGTASPTSAIEDVGGGRYRCSITCVASTSASHANYILLADIDGRVTYAGATDKYLYAWGAQLEAGASASSYIPTTTASVQRAKDQFEIDNTAGVHCLGASGTIICAITLNALAGVSQDILYHWIDNENRMEFYVAATGKLSTYLEVVNVSQLAGMLGTDVLVAGRRYVVALAWQENDVRQYVNGADEKADTAADMMGNGNLYPFSKANSANFLEGTGAHLLFYNRALAAADIATLSAEIAEWMA